MKKKLHNKKIKLNKKKIITILFAVFIGSHILISSLRYIYNEYDHFYSTRNSLENYLTKHKKELEEKVFYQIFNDAKKCRPIHSPTDKTDCPKEIGHNLAITIKEEEFLSWPHDLFFVKKTGNKFYKLGWDGELKEIGNISSFGFLEKKQSNFYDYLLRNCNYFGTAGIPASSCEIYVTTQLNNNEIGYIVREIPLLEEDDFILYSFFPFLALFGCITSFMIAPYREYWELIIVGVIPFLLVFITYLLIKRNAKIKK